MTLAISAMSFAAAQDYKFVDVNQQLGDLTDVDNLDVYGCTVEIDSINGGNPVYASCYSKSHKETAGGGAPSTLYEYPATLKVNSNVTVTYGEFEGLSSSNVASLIANEIIINGKVAFTYANVHSLEGNLTISGRRDPDGWIGRSSLTNTNLIADKGSINIGKYLTMESGSISATNGDVNINDATVTVNGLSAKNVNINGTGVLNIGNELSLANDGGELSLADVCRVEVGEITVGTGAKLGINGATLVFHKGSSITLLEGATLTAFDNVNFEFIVDADSITDDGVAYSFDVFKGMTDDGNLALIEGFEDAVAAGEIGITLKGMTAEGELIDLDASSANVSFKDGTLSVSNAGSVPEPTTATLSLLALAALAARRRRR